MKVSLYIVFFLFFQLAYTQQEFHVFPKNHQETPGKQAGDGSLNSPWDLQTALNQSTDVINGGDTIWLHEGIYNGRFVSTIKSGIKGKFITVSAYKKDKVVLNGNINSDLKSVLQVKGKQVIYKNFEITFKGNFSRIQGDKNFSRVNGLSHVSGENCKFINLIIHNVPGSGIGSWKATGGTLISDCIIYNNGYYSKKRGSGVGIYVQNMSNATRTIKNNIIFNNYYKGIEVWSAAKKSNISYVKNVLISSNIIFNHGLPTGKNKDNLLIATNDRTGINIAENIVVRNNVLYHNTNFKENKASGDAASLTIGFIYKAPVKDVLIQDNIIVGRNNALRLLHAKSLRFERNTVYSGYVLLSKASVYKDDKIWNFTDNKYYTKGLNAFRVGNDKDFSLSVWKSTFELDKNSKSLNIKDFLNEPIIRYNQSNNNKNKYHISILNKTEENVIVNFSNQEITEGVQYTIRDVENLSEVLKTGVITKNRNIEFPMKLNKGSKTKTLDNFGVFIVEFSEPKKVKVGFFKRIFGWLF